MDQFWTLLNNDTIEGMNPVQQQRHTHCSMADITRFDDLTGDRRKTLDILALGRSAGRSYKWIQDRYLRDGDTPGFRRTLMEGRPTSSDE